MVNNRLRLVKSQDHQKSDKQLAIEDIEADRVTTPTLKHRKVDVIENDHRKKEEEKIREREERRKQEIDDAIQGKR